MTKLGKAAIFICLLLACTMSWGQNAALMIIDMQDEFSERDGYLNQQGNRERLNQVIERQRQLIQLAKENQLPIIIVEYEDSGPTDEKLLNEIGSYKNFRTFTKRTDGVFNSRLVAKELKNHLDSLQVDELIISGANGGYCVRCSIEGALVNGYKVWADNHSIIELNTQIFIFPYYYKHGELRVKSRYLSEKFSQARDPKLIEDLLRRKGTDILDHVEACAAAPIVCEPPNAAEPPATSCSNSLVTSALRPFRFLLGFWK